MSHVGTSLLNLPDCHRHWHSAHDPTFLFYVTDPALNLVSLEIEEGRLIYGASVALAYLLLFIAFIVGHTPVATPVKHEVPILRYTEAKEYRSDNASAYRGWLFMPVLWVNVLVVCLYIVNTIGIIYTLVKTGREKFLPSAPELPQY